MLPVNGPPDSTLVTPPAPVDETRTIVEGRPPASTLPGAAEDAGGPRQAGRYVIGPCLGRGGMASVFRAHDPGIGRDVAIKFLHASLCADADCRSRFLREARAAGALSHPNIVTVHDVGEIDGRPYMAMELLLGDPLTAMLGAGSPLPVRHAVEMALQLARALDYAHARGVVHRDIKPGNIVRLTGSMTIKVTDFGIAHVEAGSSGEQATRLGDVLGTPQYMSPEQTRGERLDGRSDLFAAGIVLYEMLAGRRPFQADSLVAVAVKIGTEAPVPLESLRPDLPPALRRIVERCLAKAPERRFQSGAELAEALSRVLADLDEADTAAARPRILPLHVRWAMAMALVVAAVMGTATAVVHQRQDAALTEQVIDYGASLSRFFAAQNADRALAEEWPAVEVAVQVVLRTGDFRSIAVIDREGIVRASGDAAQVGQPYRAPPADPLATRPGPVQVTRQHAGAESVLGFTTPITFSGKDVGRVALTLTEGPLRRVAQVSLGWMAALGLTTVVAAAVTMVFMARRLARPIRVLADAMEQVARGRLGHRIGETRRDEFGLLFNAFDRMAHALQERTLPAATPAPAARPADATEGPAA